MITVITNDGEEDEYPITLTFNEVLFRVEIPMKQGYQLDLSVSDFNLLIGYEKKIVKDENALGLCIPNLSFIPNLSQDRELINIKCDHKNNSLVDGSESDTISSFWTAVLQPSLSFTMEAKSHWFTTQQHKHGFSKDLYHGWKKKICWFMWIWYFFFNFIETTIMRPYEFKRIYPPALGKFVNKHKGTGVLVTNVKKNC